MNGQKCMYCFITSTCYQVVVVDDLDIGSGVGDIYVVCGGGGGAGGYRGGCSGGEGGVIITITFFYSIDALLGDKL